MEQIRTVLEIIGIMALIVWIAFVTVSSLLVWHAAPRNHVHPKEDIIDSEPKTGD